MASGMMIEGKWTTDGNKPDPGGKFKETPTTFRDRVTADGSSAALLALKDGSSLTAALGILGAIAGYLLGIRDSKTE
jgi:glutathionyl-hydroquinone reductase